ncbi:MAG: hypothetical protein R2737_06420 [Candidatus Nanopelagicales bacterium]
MTRIRTRAAALAVAAAIAVPVALAAPALAAPATPQQTSTAVAAAAQPTSAQLASWGFTKKPNVTAWGGTAKISTNSAKQYQDVLLTGTAPSFAKPGQVLTLKRFVPTDNKGSGYMVSVGAQTKVNKDGSYTLHMQLGRTGLYGYTVGYSTGGSSPEWVGVEFQLRTTSV